MRKFRKFLCIIFSLILLFSISFQAFAAETEDLILAKEDVLNYADKCEDLYVFYYGLESMSVPVWSDESTQRMIDTVAKVRDEIDKCQTVEDIEGYRALLNDAVDKMCISSSELQWMLDYMERDYKSTGYYDDETYAELKNIYEIAQTAIESGVDIDIHNSYIDMRNELNKLCSYNLVRYDVNFDGDFNIKDCTLMQLYLAKFVDFNSSQCYVAGFNHNSTIISITEMQLMLAKLSKQEYVKEIEANFVELDPSIRNFYVDDYEGSNYMYNYDRYVWWM